VTNLVVPLFPKIIIDEEDSDCAIKRNLDVMLIVLSAPNHIALFIV
jgi:hypothetical protein